ncbi:CCR4-NOT transcription complex subunit 3 [Exaiptasia diaphana]|nr:CCR4-NOT transcription complex subunit 3 [Exaiptasia diaphana]
MADKRKLQGEIERCLKKVSEGVETFEDIWQKVHNASNSNQKEKYEADLKKEIKKLQRLRDQIKTWVASNDIKDKKTLLDNRKLIEQQMERFKVVERETKTKAYSKEGLGLAAKIDPAQKEKEEARQWITEVLDKLRLQVDQFESEVEQMFAGSKKKKLDKDKQDKVEELHTWAEKHRYHTEKLEIVLRMLDNGKIESDDIKQLRDDMDYHLDCFQDPDYQENEFMYDDFDFEEETGEENDADSYGSPLRSRFNDSSLVPDNSPRKNSKGTSSLVNSILPGTTPPRPPLKPSLSNPGQPSTTPVITAVETKPSNGSSKTTSSIITNSFENHSSSNGEEVLSSSKTPTEVTPPPPVSGYAVVAGGQQNHVDAQPPRMVNHTPATTTSSTSSIARPTSSVVNSHDHILPHSNGPFLSDVNHASDISKLVSAVTSLSMSPAPTINATSNTFPGRNPALGKPSSSVVGPPPPVSTPLTAPSSLPSSSLPNSSSSIGMMGMSGSMTSSLLTSSSNTVLSKPPMSSVESIAVSTGSVGSLMSSAQFMGSPVSRHVTTDSFSSLKSIAAQAVATANLHSQVQLPNEYSAESRELENRFNTEEKTSKFLTRLFDSTSTSRTLEETKVPIETNTAHLQPLLGVAPLGPVPLNKERCYQLAMLEAAHHHLPQPADSERVRPCLSRNPYPAPPYYHQHPPAHLESIDFYQRLQPETLFFIFYYQEGTRAQYLAAKALKKQSWRFHTKYMMWFQRHEEPKAITDEYEQGTYIYFDYEKWGQRKKEGFTFEYRYLEDKDLP